MFFHESVECSANRAAMRSILPGKAGDSALAADSNTMYRLFIWLLSLFVLVACEGTPRQDLRFSLVAAPVTLDPRFDTDAASERINRLLYRHLVDFDETFRPIPDLASWTQIEPTRYRFTLKNEGRIFHDGSRLTTMDVKATYDALLNPASGSPYRAALANLREVIVQDPDCLDFVLTRPDPWFPGRLNHGIVPAHLLAIGHDFVTHPVGSGPFAFVARPEEGKLRLRRQKDGLTMEFLEVKDPTVRVLKLLRGEVDLLQGDLPPELLRYLEKRPEVRISRSQGITFSYLGFNLNDPVTADLRIRQAVAHALDREECVRYLLGGNARLAEALLPPEHWAGHPALNGIPHDSARARSLLAAAGYGPDHPLTLVYKTSSDPLRVRIATLFQRQLAEVGIRVDLRNYDWGTFYGDIKAGRFQMFSLSWVGIKTPEIFRYVFHSASLPPDGANRGHYANLETDSLIESAESATSLAAASSLYQKLQALLIADLPYVPLWYEDQVAVVRREIEGYATTRDGNYDALALITKVTKNHDGP
ncbi:peptide/nickel transport system substrate-binding protein [Gammaproteobacteria bacterium]